MNKKNAAQAVQKYLNSKFKRQDIEWDAESIGVIETQLETLSQNSVSDYEVAQIVNITIPRWEEDEVKPPANPDKLRQAQRSANEVAAEVIGKFITEYWSKVAPRAIVPMSNNGSVLNAINYKAFIDAIREVTVLGGGDRPVRHDVLSEIVIGLDRNGLLQHHAEAPQVVTKVVEVEKPKSKSQLLQEAGVNVQPRTTEWERYERDYPKAPVMTEQEKKALNARNTEQNAILSEAQRRIQLFTGATHGRTASGRAQLSELFKQLVTSGTDANEILSQVDRKIDQLAGNFSIR